MSNKGPSYGQYGKGASGYQHYKIATNQPSGLNSGCAGWFALLFCLGLLVLAIAGYIVGMNFIGDLLGW